MDYVADDLALGVEPCGAYGGFFMFVAVCSGGAPCDARLCYVERVLAFCGLGGVNFEAVVGDGGEQRVG